MAPPFLQQGFLGAFLNTKPKDLDEVCKDVELWVFIQAVAPFMQKAGRLRQWGGGCCCHETELLRGPKVACEKKGMRLAEALDSCFFEEQVAWLNALFLGAVPCNRKVLGYINVLVPRFIAELRQRLKLPCRFVNTTDLTVANSILKSWRNLPRERRIIQ